MTGPGSTQRLHPAPSGGSREDFVPPTDDEGSRVVARPDGFYWVADDGHQQFGPFPSAQDALLALREGLETGLEPDETLEQVEDEIGFVDPKVADEGAPRE
jgi:hypothetical protein